MRIWYFHSICVRSGGIFRSKTTKIPDITTTSFPQRTSVHGEETKVFSGLDSTRFIYENDRILVQSIGFDEAWETIIQIVQLFEKKGVIPFQFTLPDSN